MEWASRSSTLAARLGDGFNAMAMAALDPEELVAVFCTKPALHRYPAAMARRTHALCVHLVDQYDGDPARIWKGVRSGATLFERINALPGYGTEKSQIFLALLAKRFGRLAPPGGRRPRDRSP